MRSQAALSVVRLAAHSARPCLPLEARKRIVSALAQRNMPGQVTIGVELLRDLAQHDPVAFHQYLWANHLAYASRYDLGRFAPGALEADRGLLFELLSEELRRQGLDPAEDLHSLLDVGCSTGFLLRHAETAVFPSTRELVGIDIDAQAVATGNARLRQLDSRAELMVAGMEELDAVLPGRCFDAVICCGSLMYLDEARAAQTVASLLGHADRVVGLIDRAHPHHDNRTLGRSAVRSLDETWIHNLDHMVLAAGGRVTSRQWQPSGEPADRGVYVVIAVPPSSCHEGASAPTAVGSSDHGPMARRRRQAR